MNDKDKLIENNPIQAAYIPNTTPAEVVVKKRLNRKAPPSLFVEYQCPTCEVLATLDAYKGPPSCSGAIPKHLPAVMKGLRVIEEE